MIMKAEETCLKRARTGIPSQRRALDVAAAYMQYGQVGIAALIFFLP
jgi:hypothetical protein